MDHRKKLEIDHNIVVKNPLQDFEMNQALETSYKQVLITSEVYRQLMVLSAFLVCLSHGSNDVPNSISPLIVVMKTAGYDTQISFFIGATGITLGLVIMGKRVLKTVGKDIIALDF